MKTKILSMLLVIVMFTLSLTSCGGNTPSGTPDTTTASEEKADSKWEDVSFNGESIIISLSDYEPMVVVKAGATNSVKYMQGPDAYTTDSVQNAVYDRNHKVETALGLDVEYQTYTYDSNPDSTLTVIENYVLADLENSPDIISTMSYGMVRAGIKGMLYNAL